jgi:hypothetical protein
MTGVRAEALLPTDERGSARRRIGTRTPRGIVALLAAWLGAVLFFGAGVAPAAFAVLAEQADAGALVGRLLPVLFYGGLVVGLALTVAAIRLSAVRRAVRRTLTIVGVVMLATCGLAQFWVAPEIARVRRAAGELDALPPDDKLRLEFGRLHAMSVALLGIAWLGGATVLIVSLLASPRRTQSVG